MKILAAHDSTYIDESAESEAYVFNQAIYGVSEPDGGRVVEKDDDDDE